MHHNNVSKKLTFPLGCTTICSCLYPIYTSYSSNYDKIDFVEGLCTCYCEIVPHIPTCHVPPCQHEKTEEIQYRFNTCTVEIVSGLMQRER